MGRVPQFDTPEKENVSMGESPIVLRRCSLTSSMSQEDDDGFMEILDEEEMKVGGLDQPGCGDCPTLGCGKWPVGIVPFILSSSFPRVPQQSDAAVPQGMENLLTAPLVRTEEAEPVRGTGGVGWSPGGWMEPRG